MSNQFKRTLVMVLSGVLLMIVGYVIGTSVISSSATGSTQVREETIIQAQAGTGPALSDLERTISEVYQRVSPSVVSINVVAERQAFNGEEGLLQGSGSGFVIDSQGHILTNYHVVQGATDIAVNFFDGTIVRGEVIGEDPDSDLAVVQVDLPAEQLFPVQFGSVDDLVIGQQVLAIGSPFGQRWTLTSGIISALERSIRGLSEQNFSIGAVIQTDAAINPGNSGGPLLNLAGQVIGINAQISTESGSNSGIGYAIPADLAARVAQDLINNGRVEYSYIGIQGGDVDLAAIETLELPNNLTGVLVTNVVEGGPAALGGLRNAMTSDGVSISDADIITSINGEPLSGISELISYLAKFTAPGDVVTLTVYRGGETVTLEVTLQPRPR